MNWTHQDLLLVPLFAIVSASWLYAECPRYEVTAVIDAPDCGFQPAAIVAQDLNNLGQVVGNYRCPGGSDIPFCWSEETGLSVLDLPETTGRAYAVNDSGQITGMMGSPFRGFIYDHGEVSEFGLISTATEAESLDINQFGVTTGYWNNGLVGPTHGFVWQDGDTIDLGITIGGEASRAHGINDAGQVVGWRRVGPSDERIAFLWAREQVIELGLVRGGFSTEARKINDVGDVIGFAWLPNEKDPSDNVRHAFLWQKGTITDLGTLEGLSDSTALGINTHGQVVGTSSNHLTHCRPFLWESGCLYELRELVPAEFSRELGGARSINDRGQILVIGFDFAAILTPTGVSPADIDGDCFAGFTDLLVLLSEWGMESSADFNCDGVVGFTDLLFLLAHWG
ncbi:MAG: hypothetical protein HKN07_08145 [Acidimicrobiia bacterium]|nr:hypothetical protein [Acidimicrobiia bacterium]